MKILAALFSLLIFVAFVTPVQAQSTGTATLTLTPLTATKSIDNLFSVEVRVNTGGVAVNTIKSYLTFDPNVLEVMSVSTAGSVATIFTENEADTLNGTVQITGAASGAGYNGTNGLFATLNIRAKAAGTSTLTFTSDSRIISNVDNSDILNFTALKNGSYTVGSGATTTPTSSGGGDSLESTDSALPQSGFFDSTIGFLLLGVLLVTAGAFIYNPYLLNPRKGKKAQEKNILKRL